MQVSRVVRKSLLLGVVNRKERWGLSWIGWLALLFMLVLAGIIVTFSIYPFLSITQRAQTDELVVEGWIPFYAVHAAAQEFNSGSYRQVSRPAVRSLAWAVTLTITIPQPVSAPDGSKRKDFRARSSRWCPRGSAGEIALTAPRWRCGIGWISREAK